MKTKDLVIGEEYAYSRFESGLAHRVKVLETGVEKPGPYAYSSPVKGFVRVRYTDQSGREDVVRPAAIRHTWAQEEERRAAEALSRKNQAESERRRVEQGVANAYRLHKALEAAGVEVKVQGYCYDENIAEALVKAGFKAEQQAGYLRFHSTYATLRDAVDGKVKMADILPLLGTEE